MSLLRHLIPAALLIFTVATCVRVGTRSGETERSAWKLVTAPPLASLSTKHIDLMTLGHRGLYDDFMTVWAIQFLADPKLTEKASADAVYGAMSSITRHLPRTEALYLFSCFVLAFDYKHPEYCEEFSVQGLRAFPNSWRIPMTQGFIAFFEQKNDIKAAAYYQLAASRPNSPPYVARLANKLAKRGFANGQDLNETMDMLRDVPGGTKIIEVLRDRMRNIEPPQRIGGPLP